MDKYIKIEQLGHGNYGSVILAKNLENKKLYAIKRIVLGDNEDEQLKRYNNEIAILKTLDHENVIKYFESFVHKKKLCIVMEYADGGDLSMIIKKHKSENKPIEEDKIWKWFYEVSKALKYLHSKKIIHRDIKSQNIFLTKDKVIKLGDFGVSKILDNTQDFTNTSLGTPYFLSPEICCGRDYNNKSDVWMIGCVLYEMSTFKKPFESDNFMKLMKVITNNKQLPIPKSYSQSLKNIIDLLLEKNPDNRPSITDVLNLDYVKNNISKFQSSDYFNEFQSKYGQLMDGPLSRKQINSNSPYKSENSKGNYNSNFSHNESLNVSEGTSPVSNLKKSSGGEACVVPVIIKSSNLIRKKHTPSCNSQQINHILEGLSPKFDFNEKPGSKKNTIDQSSDISTEFTSLNLGTPLNRPEQVTPKNNPSHVNYKNNLIPSNKKANFVGAISKKGHSRQISFNVSTSQFLEGNNGKSKNNTSTKNSTNEKNVFAIENLEVNEIKKNEVKKFSDLKKNSHHNDSINLVLQFIESKTCKEKAENLRKCLENCDNLLEFPDNQELFQKIFDSEWSRIAGLLRLAIHNLYKSK